MKYKISFPNTSYPELELPEKANLSEELSATNSPVLFGCRTGLCGTCLIEVDSSNSDLEEPNEIEKEALSIYAPGNLKARLACQVQVKCNMSLRALSSQ
ncbi:MAG: 2Fe-2S iron-sulfur cluster-binding protein [Candidatus Caenarcaniphilales bacterium]|nr:2Fe-2S iron-sulfur cluster-binding protein [Candidatus Caenarcaniphilales bacterium]